MMKKRMTPKARAGLRAMAAYFTTCLDSWGKQFEAAPRSPEEAAEINAALSYLGMGGIDYEGLVSDETEE